MDANTSKAAELDADRAPAASQAAVDSGADAGLFVDKADLLAELGATPEAQAGAAAPETADPEVAAPAEGDTAPAEAETPAEAEAGAKGAESESEAAPTGETEEESGESEESQPTEKPEKPAVQQRIDELTARAKTAEEQLAQAREQLSALKAQSSDANALAAVEDIGELQSQRDRYLFLHQWALENPDGGKMPAKDGKEIDLSREEVAKLQATTFRLINKDVPARAHYLAVRQSADAAAVNSYPWLKDVAKGWGHEVHGAVEQLPKLREYPNYRLIAANALVGEKLRQAGIRVDDALIARLAKEQGKPSASAAKPVAKPPPAPARAGTVPPRIQPKAAQQRVAQQRVVESGGSEDALVASIAGKLR